MDEQERYRRAKRHVEALKGFYIHAAIYLLVNASLVVINFVTSSDYLWFVWPLLAGASAWRAMPSESLAYPACLAKNGKTERSTSI